MVHSPFSRANFKPCMRHSPTINCCNAWKVPGLAGCCYCVFLSEQGGFFSPQRLVTSVWAAAVCEYQLFEGKAGFLIALMFKSGILKQHPSNGLDGSLLAVIQVDLHQDGLFVTARLANLSNRQQIPARHCFSMIDRAVPCYSLCTGVQTLTILHIIAWQDIFIWVQ